MLREFEEALMADRNTIRGFAGEIGLTPRR